MMVKFNANFKLLTNEMQPWSSNNDSDVTLYDNCINTIDYFQKQIPSQDNHFNFTLPYRRHLITFQVSAQPVGIHYSSKHKMTSKSKESTKDWAYELSFYNLMTCTIAKTFIKKHFQKHFCYLSVVTTKKQFLLCYYCYIKPGDFNHQKLMLIPIDIQLIINSPAITKFFCKKTKKMYC